MKKDGNHYVAEPGLYLQVRSERGSRSWLFRYSRDGRTHWVGLGPAGGVAPVPLDVARAKAMSMYLAVRDGGDPVADKRAARAERKPAKSAAPTFQWCADQYIASHEASWRNDKHRAQWESTLRSYAGPVIGSMPVDTIVVDDVLRVLKPLWTGKPETASRLRGRIERVLGWAAAGGHRSGDNPARWQGGALSHLLPPLGRIQKVVPRKAVPYPEVPALVTRFRALDSVSARALLWTILTATRTGEAIGARWSEVDVAAKVWVIPADRMKAGVEHRVSLSDEALALIGPKPKKDGFIFPGARPNRPLSNMSLLMCLRGLRGDTGETVHGFRSAFSTWAAEKTEYAPEVVEASLAHATGDAVRQAYQRSDYLAKRAGLMKDWAAFLFGGA